MNLARSSLKIHASKGLDLHFYFSLILTFSLNSAGANCNICVCDDGMMALLKNNFAAAEMLWDTIESTEGKGPFLYGRKEAGLSIQEDATPLSGSVFTYTLQFTEEAPGAEILE